MSSVSQRQEERAELLKLVLEKIGGQIAERALPFVEKLILWGAVFDVVNLGWEWVKGGIEAIDEAHEKGDQKARIGIYAYAWSQTVVEGHHDNTGAIGAEAHEAMELGIRDGLATRELNPELPAALLLEYGSKENARHALQDAVFGEAGIPIVTHSTRANDDQGMSHDGGAADQSGGSEAE